MTDTPKPEKLSSRHFTRERSATVLRLWPANSDRCSCCGVDLEAEEHDSDCLYYSYGGEDSRT